MHKGYIFDLLTLSNSICLTFFRIFYIEIEKDVKDYGPYITNQLGIWKASIGISLVWRNDYEEITQKAEA